MLDLIVLVNMAKYNSRMRLMTKQHAVTKFLTAENAPQVDIHRRVEAVYGETCHKGSPAPKIEDCSFFWQRHAHSFLFWDVQNSCLLAQTLTLSGTVKSCES
jgi:hypothetical protein